MNKINHTMYRGTVNKQLSVVYQYQKTNKERFETVREFNGTMSIKPSFSVSIGEPYGSPNHVFIPSSLYFHFVVLFDKSVKLVQQHLTELFPEISKTEFEIDSKVLDRFMTEKAMSVNGMTIIPCTWVNDTDECFPAIQLNTEHGTCRIPLGDAIAIAQMLTTFDPITCGLLMLNMIGY